MSIFRSKSGEKETEVAPKKKNTTYSKLFRSKSEEATPESKAAVLRASTLCQTTKIRVLYQKVRGI